VIVSHGLISPHTAGVCLLLAATLAGTTITSHRNTFPLAARLETIPFNIGGFAGITNPPLAEGVLRELKATSYISRRYLKGGMNADLFIAYYAQQRAGESMHSPKHCLPGSGWEIWDYDTIQIPAAGQTFTLNKYSISHAGDRRLVLYWYQSRERIFASEYLGKLLLARDALLRNSTAASIVRIIVPDRPGALEDGSDFAAAIIPEMQRCLGR